MTMLPLGITVHAEGEVRDANGNLVDRPHTTQTEVVQVDLDELRAAVRERGLTDDQLRQIGLDEHAITQIRSDT